MAELPRLFPPEGKALGTGPAWTEEGNGQGAMVMARGQGGNGAHRCPAAVRTGAPMCPMSAWATCHWHVTREAAMARGIGRGSGRRQRRRHRLRWYHRRGQGRPRVARSGRSGKLAADMVGQRIDITKEMPELNWPVSLANPKDVPRGGTHRGTDGRRHLGKEAKVIVCGSGRQPQHDRFNLSTTTPSRSTPGWMHRQLMSVMEVIGCQSSL